MKLVSFKRGLNRLNRGCYTHMVKFRKDRGQRLTNKIISMRFHGTDIAA